MFWLLDYMCLVALLVSALLTAFLRNLAASVLALSALGTILTALFVVLAAPDVALAEIVVGTVAMPVLYFVTLGKLRTVIRHNEELGEATQDVHDGP